MARRQGCWCPARRWGAAAVSRQGPPASHAGSARAVPPGGAWGRLAQLYATADARSLGLFRILLGALLAVDVALRFPEVQAHWSNTGWLTNHFALFRPISDHLFSVYFALNSPNEVKLLLSVHVLSCLLLLVGYRTKLMQILVLILTTSLNSRNLLLESDESVMLNIVLVWTAFLPLGRRFSVDALMASPAARPERLRGAAMLRSASAPDLCPVVSVAITALLLHASAIYCLDTLGGAGPPWRDGTALYYLLQQERLLTGFGFWLRESLPLGLIQLATYATFVIGGAVPLLLWLPWRTAGARMLALALATLLLLMACTALQSGAFSWALWLVLVIFMPARLWTWAAERSEPQGPAVGFGLDCVPPDSALAAAEPSQARLLGRRMGAYLQKSVVLALLAAVATQMLLDRWVVTGSLEPRRGPAVLRAVLTYPRLLPTWSRSGELLPLGQGRLVIDGRTRDGRHFDPLTGAAPAFEVHPAGMPRTSRGWDHFHARVAQDRFRPYWAGVGEFLMNHHRLTERPQDALASFDAYYVSETFSPPGEKRVSAERRLLFSNQSVSASPDPAAVVRPKAKSRRPRGP